MGFYRNNMGDRIQMETLKNAPLKRAFIYMVCCTTIFSTALSGLTIYGCYRLQRMLLPVSNEAILTIISTSPNGETSKQQQRFEFGEKTSVPVFFAVGIDYDGEPDPEEYAAAGENLAAEFTVDRIDNNFTLLSPKRQFAYAALSAVKIVLPLLYFAAGIMLCAAWFYKGKLRRPIQVLLEAAENVSNENLDFSLDYQSEDELGQLCVSFETMQQALAQKHRELWGMVEDRQRLMASVAHDLRNPISIMEGYLEYLRVHIPRQDVSQEDMLSMIDQISGAAARLERYTDYLRDIYLIEEQELHWSAANLPQLLNEMAEAFVLLAEKEQLQVKVTNLVPSCRARLDEQTVYRILENVFMNALRFAKSQIQIRFALEDHILTAQITDDGPGFPEYRLQKNGPALVAADKTGKHIGMGLATCRVLCRKHGGGLKLENPDGGGARVTVQISVENF